MMNFRSYNEAGAHPLIIEARALRFDAAVNRARRNEVSRCRDRWLPVERRRAKGPVSCHSTGSLAPLMARLNPPEGDGLCKQASYAKPMEWQHKQEIDFAE